MKKTAHELSPQTLKTYARKWGATGVPFEGVSEASWLSTPPLERAWELLDQTAALRGVMFLAGANGIGKSVLAARWLDSLDRRLYEPVAITHATLSGSSLLSAVTAKLGKGATFRRERNLALIEEALTELENRALVLVLDEAQNFASSALEEIRLLLGLNLPKQPTFALVLLGDEYFLNTLRLRHHRALYSRISCHYRLPLWQPEEIRSYLQSGFSAVGIQREVIEPAAEELLATASDGLPRSLALLARTAWIEASRNGHQSITAEDVQAAIDQIPFTPGKQNLQPTTESYG